MKNPAVTTKSLRNISFSETSFLENLRVELPSTGSGISRSHNMTSLNAKFITINPNDNSNEEHRIPLTNNLNFSNKNPNLRNSIKVNWKTDRRILFSYGLKGFETSIFWRGNWKGNRGGGFNLDKLLQFFYFSVDILILYCRIWKFSFIIIYPYKSLYIQYFFFICFYVNNIIVVSILPIK